MKTNPQLIRGMFVALFLAGLGAGVPALRAEDAPAAKAVKLPFTVYDEKGGANNHYIPSGWMGKTAAIKMNLGWVENPHSAPSCMQFQFNSDADWGGIIWQDPADDWGDRDGGWNLIGAKKLV